VHIRRYRREDGPILAKCYDSEKHGSKPVDFDSPEMAAAFVLVDDEDIPRAALGGRKTVEMQLVMDSTWETPQVRMAVLTSLARESFKTLLALGYRGAHCWLDDSIVRPYSRRLRLFGMVKELRQSFRLEVD
jgi:hypothetical protein